MHVYTFWDIIWGFGGIELLGTQAEIEKNAEARLRGPHCVFGNLKNKTHGLAVFSLVDRMSKDALVRESSLVRSTSFYLRSNTKKSLNYPPKGRNLVSTPWTV